MEAGGWGSGLGSLTESQGAADGSAAVTPFSWVGTPIFLWDPTWPLSQSWGSCGADTAPHCTSSPGGGVVYPGLAIESSSDLGPVTGSGGGMCPTRSQTLFEAWIQLYLNFTLQCSSYVSQTLLLLLLLLVFLLLQLHMNWLLICKQKSWA